MSKKAAQLKNKGGRGTPKGPKDKAKSSTSKSSTKSDLIRPAQSSHTGRGTVQVSCAASQGSTSQAQSSHSGRGIVQPSCAASQASTDSPKLPPKATASISISVSSDEDDNSTEDDDSGDGSDGWEDFECRDLSDWRDMRYIAESLAQRANTYTDYWTQSQRDRLALAFLACATAMKPSK